MVQMKIFAIFMASVFVLNFVNCAANAISVDIANVEFTTVPNITQFLTANPKIKLIQTFTQFSRANHQITYKIGDRLSGDKLLSRSADSNQYSTLQDVTLTLTYPAGGTGGIITCVEVIVEQSSNFARGYFVSGGLGQRNIKIIIEAQRTLYFRHIAAFFGH